MGRFAPPESVPVHVKSRLDMWLGICLVKIKSFTFTHQSHASHIT